MGDCPTLRPGQHVRNRRRQPRIRQPCGRPFRWFVECVSLGFGVELGSWVGEPHPLGHSALRALQQSARQGSLARGPWVQNEVSLRKVLNNGPTGRSDHAERRTPNAEAPVPIGSGPDIGMVRRRKWDRLRAQPVWPRPEAIAFTVSRICSSTAGASPPGLLLQRASSSTCRSWRGASAEFRRSSRRCTSARAAGTGAP